VRAGEHARVCIGGEEQVFEGQDDLRAVERGLALVKPLAPVEQNAKVASAEKFHHHEEVACACPIAAACAYPCQASAERLPAERQERKTRSTATEANDQGSRHGLKIASALTSGGRAAEAALRERANTAGSGRAGTLRLEAEEHLDYVRAPRIHQDALLDLGELLGVLCFHLAWHTRAAL
jgi:hypothetical protein